MFGIISSICTQQRSVVIVDDDQSYRDFSCVPIYIMFNLFSIVSIIIFNNFIGT